MNSGWAEVDFGLAVLLCALDYKVRVDALIQRRRVVEDALITSRVSRPGLVEKDERFDLADSSSSRRASVGNHIIARTVKQLA